MRTTPKFPGNLSYGLASLFTLIAGLAMAQTASLTGSVRDETTQEMLEYATIGLYTPTDSTIVTGTVSRDDGTFALSDVKPGTYYLMVQFVGYQSTFLPTLTVQPNEQRDVGVVTLRATDEMLEEISITGEKASVYHKVDRQVYNAAQFQSATGGTATDVLRNIPSVAVDAAGTMTVRGSSGFTILLNGQPIQSDPSMILSQLPANAVENVEIVTAPSAKYDPEGKAGIINIITRKGGGDGWYVLVNGQLGLPSVEDYDNAEPAPRYGEISLSTTENKPGMFHSARATSDTILRASGRAMCIPLLTKFSLDSPQTGSAASMNEATLPGLPSGTARMPIILLVWDSTPANAARTARRISFTITIS